MMYAMMPYRSHRLPQQRPRSLFDDQFFRPFFEMNDWMGSRMGFRVDIHDEDSHYMLEAELPGVTKDQINLSVENDTLTISADMRSEHNNEKTCYSERRMGHVSRSFSLEGIDQDHITADYKNGILYVTMPKSQPEEAPGARRIAITGGDGEEEKKA